MYSLKRVYIGPPNMYGLFADLDVELSPGNDGHPDTGCRTPEPTDLRPRVLWDTPKTGTFGCK